MSFQPQRIFPWPGKRAVLLVHGIGDASTGKDGAFPLDVLKRALGADAANIAIYRINYDFINDWLSTKVNFQAGIAALKAKVKKNLGSDDLDATIADYAGDVVWPVLSVSHRFAVRDAILAQLNQIQVDRNESAARRGEDPLDYEISIVAHSLGCFHTYEALSAAASEPAHRLRPATDLFTLKSVFLMASPVQLIQSVAGAIEAFIPNTASLASLSTLAIPSETRNGRVVPCTRNFIAITGTHDPVGGHLMGTKLAWAYMDIADQKSVIVPQQLLDIDTKEGTAKALANAIKSGGPSVNDPHSWSANIENQTTLLREVLLT